MSQASSAPEGRSYTAYGLGIRSAIPLTEFLPSGAGSGEVVVRLGPEPHWVAGVRDRRDYLAIASDEARFWFKGVGGFTVTSGSEIAIHPENGVDLSLLRLYVEGMMMAMTLHQRGFCVLHASVVDMGGYAVAFVGHVGAGKSSLAGALYARGYRVLSDDNAAVDLSAGHPTTVPAYPCLKLFPAIASVLGFENGSLGVLHPSLPKLGGSIQSRFDPAPLPLKRLYVLGRDHSPEISSLSSLKTFVELIKNSAPTRWGHPGDSRQFEQCGVLATVLEAYTLRSFADPASLPALAAAVVEHCAGESAHATAGSGRVGAPRASRPSSRKGGNVKWIKTKNRFGQPQD
jgi:hypothetical protein